MSPFWIIVIIGVVWWIATRSNRALKAESIISSGAVAKEEHISDEVVFKRQNAFEEQLQQTFLPDALSRKDIYTYWKLMLPWYNQLSGQHRYDQLMSNKLKNDWLQYMWSLEQASTSNYLWLETPDDDKETSEKYKEESILESRKAFAIENAFAAAIGEDAVKELQRIREKDLHSFSRRGELAPDGHIYNLDDKLQREKHG